MGTRADFYVGRGESAEWIGSVAYDGYVLRRPEGSGIRTEIVDATDERSFRDAVAHLLSIRDDATTPGDGWPWSWNDSGTTDYAYAFDGGKVHASCSGSPWYDPKNKPENDEYVGEPAMHPDMSGRKNVAHDRRSGLLFVSTGR